jgi:hypothetical protein
MPPGFGGAFPKTKRAPLGGGPFHLVEFDLLNSGNRLEAKLRDVFGVLRKKVLAADESDHNQADAELQERAGFRNGRIARRVGWRIRRVATVAGSISAWWCLGSGAGVPCSGPAGLRAGRRAEDQQRKAKDKRGNRKPDHK